MREDFNRFIELEEKRWEENNKRWEENWHRWEENVKWWEKNWKLWEENSKRWEEAYKRFEAIEKTLLEHSVMLRNLNKRVSRLELELSALSEITLTMYVWEDLKEEFKIRGEEVVVKMRNVKIDGYKVDLLIETSKYIYIVEVKVKSTKRHVNRLLEKTKVVQEKYRKPVVRVLAGTLIGSDIEEYARSKNIKIYY